MAAPANKRGRPPGGRRDRVPVMVARDIWKTITVIAEMTSPHTSAAALVEHLLREGVATLRGPKDEPPSRWRQKKWEDLLIQWRAGETVTHELDEDTQWEVVVWPDGTAMLVSPQLSVPDLGGANLDYCLDDARARWESWKRAISCETLEANPYED